MIVPFVIDSTTWWTEAHAAWAEAAALILILGIDAWVACMQLEERKEARKERQQVEIDRQRSGVTCGGVTSILRDMTEAQLCNTLWAGHFRHSGFAFEKGLYVLLPEYLRMKCEPFIKEIEKPITDNQIARHLLVFRFPYPRFDAVIADINQLNFGYVHLVWDENGKPIPVIRDPDKAIKLEDERLEELRRQTAREQPQAKLTIHPDQNSEYLLKPYASMRLGRFISGYFRFALRIDNRGDLNSSIVKYDIYIKELGQTFSGLTPEEQNHGVDTRHGVQSLFSENGLSDSGVVSIDSGGTSGYGMLIFLIPNLNEEIFATVGLHPQGEEKRYPPLHCHLTVTDMNGASASAEFTLTED